MLKKSTVILWFRQDFRLIDNLALNDAFEKYDCVIPVYIYSPDEEKPWQPGQASQWWLHHSLIALQSDLREKYGLALQIRSGNSADQLKALVLEGSANAIFWNRRYEPEIIKRDESIKNYFKETDIYVKSYNSTLLFEPWQIKNKKEQPYKVFTKFYKTCLAQPLQNYQITKPSKIPASVPLKTNLSIESLMLLPKHAWDKKFHDLWCIGEESAQQQFMYFIEHHLNDYQSQRDVIAKNVTSVLSTHIHFGEISPRQIFSVTQQLKLNNETGIDIKAIDEFERQLIWREFSHHLLFNFPHSSQQVFNQKYATFPWHSDQKILDLWQQGNTGIPLIDAGMKQLWQTGIMHNRVRMIVASFLVKNLGQHWLNGARWFWETLLDADLANNTMGWQWVAGCGADAAPYYRIFNPVRQGELCDPDGDYVRKWIPELSRLPSRYIHSPWQASTSLLKECRVKLSENYPEPLVDLAESRKNALEISKTWLSNQNDRLELNV